MSETRSKRKIEFIESYWTGGELGSDYQWNDNHGELIRCKDCRNAVVYDGNEVVCAHIDSNGNDKHTADWFCADGERKDS